MPQTSLGVTVAIQTGRSLVSGGFIAACAIFLVVVLFFVLVYARSLGSRTHQQRDEVAPDSSRVIGRSPRPTAMADTTTIRVLRDGGEAKSESLLVGGDVWRMRDEGNS